MKRTQDDNHKFLGNLKTFFSLKTSAAKLHLQGKISCYWTTKESSFIGPMPVFAKEKEYFVLFFVLNQFIVTPCGSLFKGKVAETISGECTIEQKIEWLYEHVECSLINANSKELKDNSQEGLKRGGNLVLGIIESPSNRDDKETKTKEERSSFEEWLLIG